MDRQNNISEADIENILSSFQNLSSEDRKTLRKFLKKQPIRKAFIREKILKQNQDYSKGFLILEGQVTISKTVGDKNVVMANLVPYQIINIEYFLYRKVNYNVTVSSSILKFVVVSSQCLQILFFHHEKSIKQRQLLHNKEVDLKNRQKEKQQNKKKNEKMLNRLSLPNIILPDKNPKLKKSISFKKQSIPAFFTYDSDQLKKEKTMKIARNTQRVNSLANEEKGSFKDPNPRNQKLFKEQLKSIIKRKLVYEKKQLGVLQAFRQDIEKVIKQQNREYEGQQNEIDLYFKL